MEIKDLETLQFDDVIIEGIKQLVVDPFKTIFNDNNPIIFYPTEDLLKDQIILYTSAWYLQYTFKRIDKCKEYVLAKKGNDWFVNSINDSSNTFIPFNQLVLSIPEKCNINYKINDKINIIKGEIPVYDIGLYNQNNYRIAVLGVNKLTWNKNGVLLYDSNSLSKVTPSRFERISTMNCYYDDVKKTYVVEKFNVNDKEGKVFTNVKNGFLLSASIKNLNNNLAILENVRFAKNDIIKIEENGDILTKKYCFSLDSVNIFTFDHGETIYFNIFKKNVYECGTRWEFEVAVDKNNVIVFTGCNVMVPEGGYKLALRVQNGTIAEQLHQILENVFTKGSVVSVIDNKLIIDSSLILRNKNLLNITKSYLNEVLYNYEVNNYSYDIDSIDNVSQTLDFLENEMNKIVCDNATNSYRLYTLIGEVNQQYFNLMAATNRNEAVQIKSCWYIYRFNGDDKDLEGIKKHLDTIKASGVNEVIIEVTNSGYADYANSSVFKLNPELVNNDYQQYGDIIKAFTGEAHKRNMTVLGGFCPFHHAIINNWPELNECFALGIDGSESVKTWQGTTKMLDPSNPIVLEKIKATIDDVLTSNPDLDGIHLDYIRYGADNDKVETVTGVTLSALSKFNAFCKDNNYDYACNTLDELRLLLKNNEDAFKAFNKYEQTQVTNTVINIKEICKKHHKPLTCAIVDEYNSAKTWKCQDWGLWAKKGYVDILYLMDYYFDDYWINYFFEDMLENTNNQTLLVTGIDPSYANLIAEYYPKTIKGAISNPNSLGYGIFGTHTQDVKKDGWDLIKSSNWITSISPLESLLNTISASANLLLKRCDDIYIKYNNQTLKQKELLNNDLKELIDLIKDDSKKTCIALMDKLSKMREKDYAINSANIRIKEQLSYMYRIVRAKNNI